MKEEISLNDILKELYTISGIQIDVYDLNGHSLARYPEQGAAFCQLVNQIPEGCNHCFLSAMSGFETVQKTHKVHIYKCHMGLYEAIVPLYHYGTLAGYMMTGQMLEQGATARETLLHNARRLPMPFGEELLSAVDSLILITPEKMESFVTMCRICADYITNHHQFPVSTAHVIKELSSYLEEHYHESLHLEQLCHWFGYSKTRLNQLFRAHTGTSIYHYLTQLRLQKACEKLRGSHASIDSIALSCGFSNQNYFSRYFKKQIGCTPGEYRKNH